jgi:ribulose bisphosphate carboxylase small subunit
MQKSHIFLLVVTLASAGVSAGLWLELRAERALNADLTARLKVAAATPVTAREPVASRTAEPPVVMAPVVANAAPAPAVAKADRASADFWQARQRKLMSDPRYRDAFREQQRLQLATRRENFIRLLGFSPEQADAVIDLSIERQMNWPSGIPQEQGEQESRTYQEKLRALLGEDKSAQLQNYMESRQTRMQVDQFRTQLTGGDALRDDQVEPLIAALQVERSQMQQDLEEYRASFAADDNSEASQRKYNERQTALLKATHDRMRTAASAILSQSQLQKLDAMLKRDLERHEAQQRMARIQSKLEPPPELPGNSN